ncbi:MAG: LEA type 2 family protein [Methanomicrobiales archaeon]|nr:LEA type 2 family protein [Methanomicrobiales archaeon]
MEWPALGVLLLFISCACLGGCINPLREPTVTMTSITLEGITLSTVSVITTIRVDNPNPVGITLASLDFDLFYETGDGERYLGNGRRENLVIPANSTTTFDIPVGIDTARAIEAAGVLLREGSLTLVARGTAAVDLKVTTVKIPFEKRKVVP